METRQSVLLFVYGSLQRGAGTPLARRLAQSSQWLGRGVIRARLYDLGAFPGAVASEDERDQVEGDLVRLLSPERTLAVLDRYELCDPASQKPHDYNREEVLVRLRNGRTMRAWTYLYRRPVSQARRIPSGRWSVSS